MLINTDIQLALAQLGIITDIDKQMRELLDKAAKYRMITNNRQLVVLLRYMYEAEEHLLKILRGEFSNSSDMYVLEKGRKLGIGEAYERYIKH